MTLWNSLRLYLPNKFPRGNSPERVWNTFLTLINKVAQKLKHADGLLFLVMTWKIWCPEVFFFFFLPIWELTELSLPRCHSFTLRVKPTEDWEVLEVRSRKVIHLFIDLLIRLALWRFNQANDEISPSFCRSVSLLCQPSLPSPGNSVSVLYPSLAPSITTPCTQVMMQFMGSVLLPYIATGAPPQVLFELRVYCGLIISWTVSLPSLHNTLLKHTRLFYGRPALFYTLWKINVSPVHCDYLCFEMWKLIAAYQIFSSWSACALCPRELFIVRRTRVTQQVCVVLAEWKWDCAIECWSCSSSAVMKLFTRYWLRIMHRNVILKSNELSCRIKNILVHL